MIKQGLELKQQQKLSPLQIQTIKLIELPIQELEQRVKTVLEENPVLDDTPPERSEDSQTETDNDTRDISIDELDRDDPIPSYRLRVNNYGKDERPEYNTFSVKESFRGSLSEQLGFRNLDQHSMDVAQFIIGSLDEDGYLRRSLDSLVDDLAFRANIETDEEEVEKLLKVIQEFEPSGVGARDLRECLLIQLAHLRPCEEVDNAKRILNECFAEFSSKHFQKIMSRLSLTQEQLKAALARIIKLNPTPGGSLDDSYEDQAQQIVPDFVLVYEDGELKMTMPRFKIPEVRLNRKYAELLEQSRGAGEKAQKDAATFVKQKLDSAKWFVEALRQRQNTLQTTMQAIIDFQHDYFIDGNEESLRPMVLKDISEVTGFDISTISRVVNSKYIETHFGIFPLKYFFSEGLENKEGEEVSTRELKKVLKEAVEGEDKSRPLTDDQLVDLLSSKGYKVARRTIAKYRDQLDIPAARMRKEL